MGDIPTVTQEVALWMQMAQADREMVLKRSLLPPTPVRLPQAEHESSASSSGVSKVRSKTGQHQVSSIQYLCTIFTAKFIYNATTGLQRGVLCHRSFWHPYLVLLWRFLAFVCIRWMHVLLYQ